MGKVLVVTSGKGGVGKTTSTAALAPRWRGWDTTSSSSISMSDCATSISSWARNGAWYSTHQCGPGRRQADAGVDPRQASRHALPASGSQTATRMR